MRDATNREATNIIARDAVARDAATWDAATQDTTNREGADEWGEYVLRLTLTWPREQYPHQGWVLKIKEKVPYGGKI